MSDEPIGEVRDPTVGSLSDACGILEQRIRRLELVVVALSAYAPNGYEVNKLLGDDFERIDRELDELKSKDPRWI